MSWIEGAFYQRHMYLQADATIAPHLDIWDLKDDNGWIETRVYIHPEHVALHEMAKRHCEPYPADGWGL